MGRPRPGGGSHDKNTVYFRSRHLRGSTPWTPPLRPRDALAVDGREGLRSELSIVLRTWEKQVRSARRIKAVGSRYGGA